MAFCPSCGVEYREGFTVCADCDAVLTETPLDAAETPEWVEVYTGRGILLGMVEDDLKRRGIPVSRQPYEELGGGFEVGVFGTQEPSVYRLLVPADLHAQRAEEIAAGVAESAGSGGPGDAAAMAEAEEDYDVRGCPSCRRYFHETYATCPCDGAALLPAVEVFTPDQLEPGIVVLRDGSQEALGEACARLQAAGFAATILHPGDCASALLAVPWGELTARTAVVMEALG